MYLLVACLSEKAAAKLRQPRQLFLNLGRVCQLSLGPCRSIKDCVNSLDIFRIYGLVFAALHLHDYAGSCGVLVILIHLDGSPGHEDLGAVCIRSLQRFCKCCRIGAACLVDAGCDQKNVCTVFGHAFVECDSLGVIRIQFLQGLDAILLDICCPSAGAEDILDLVAKS